MDWQWLDAENNAMDFGRGLAPASTARLAIREDRGLRKISFAFVYENEFYNSANLLLINTLSILMV